MSVIGNTLQNGSAKVKRSLPLQLKFLLSLAIGLTVIFCLVIEGGTAQHRNAAKSIGIDSAPSVFAAYDIKVKAQTLDADAAKILTAKPGQDMVSVRDFEATRIKLAEALVTAAENITFGDAEREPLRKLQDAVSDYQGAVARAVALHERGDPAYIVEYHNSLKALREQILPAADALETANTQELEHTVSVQGKESLGTFALALLAGLALVGTLVYTQTFLSRQFKRRFNTGLLAATALTILTTLYVSVAFLTQSTLLSQAKRDAYDSVLALYKAKSFAHEANAAASRYLLDKPLAANHEMSFKEAAAKLAASDRAGIDRALGLADKFKPAELKVQLNNQQMAGSLIDELRNITFDQEQEAATATLRSFATYLDIDRKMRDLETAGKHEEAVAIAVGMSKGESNWAFAEFNKNLDATLEINRNSFNKDVASALARVSGLPWLNPLVALLIGVAIFLGLRPRIKEFPESAFKKVKS